MSTAPWTHSRTSNGWRPARPDAGWRRGARATRPEVWGGAPRTGPRPPAGGRAIRSTTRAPPARGAMRDREGIAGLARAGGPRVPSALQPPRCRLRMLGQWDPPTDGWFARDRLLAERLCSGATAATAEQPPDVAARDTRPPGRLRRPFAGRPAGGRCQVRRTGASRPRSVQGGLRPASVRRPAAPDRIDADGARWVGPPGGASRRRVSAARDGRVTLSAEISEAETT